MAKSNHISEQEYSHIIFIFYRMKSIRLIILSLIFLSVCQYSSAKEAVIDTTLVLKETVVIGKKPAKKTNVGSKVTHFDQSVITRSKTKNLADMLSENSTINIKSLGQGALSTASFRGTSANHTQVLWNGISLNSASLGSFDFSQIPIYFTDDVTLFHGASSQQSGSGALGGSVNFSSSDQPVAKPYLSVMGEYGANNTITGGGTFRISKGRFTSSTKVYYQQSDNDYLYLNKVYSNEPFLERRKEADYSQAGAMQEFYYKTKKGDKISFISWYQFDDKSIPQSIISSATAKEQIKSYNVRTIANFESERDKHKYKISVANLWSDMQHSRDFGTFSDLSKNQNNSYVVRGDYQYNAHKKIDIGTTLNYRYDNVKSSAFEDGSIGRNTLSARVFGVFKPIRRLHFDVDATGEKVDNKIYGIYNVSARYLAIYDLLTFKASNAYNYRIPTLNDLYWSPGGNPDLKPESGFSWDASAIISPTFGRFKLEVELLYYYMNINDWIMWIPKDNGYIWSPVNFSNVISQGAELNAKLSFKTRTTRHSLTANYGYAHSVDNSDRGDDAHGKQLPYIPRNKANATYEFWFKDLIWFNYNVSYTDVRFTSADQEYYTNAYTLHNLEVGGRIPLAKNHNLRLSLKVDNLFNAYYESTQYFPMPLRMWRLQLTYHFN